MNYSYKKITIDDIEFVQSVFKVKEYKDIFFEQNTSIKGWTQRLSAIKEFEIVFDGNNKIGVINVLNDDNCIKILLLSLKDKLRGKGIGTKIFNDLLSTYPNTRFELSVMKSNERAVKFYKKLKFIITKEFIEDYGDNGKHPSYEMVREEVVIK